MEESETDPEDVHAVRKVPTDLSDIADKARVRNPVNHTTVMFRRPAVLSAGNYQRALGMEDYDLWVRMLTDGSNLRNLPAVLTKARIDRQYGRRGGVSLARSEAARQYEFLRTGFIDWSTFLFNLCTRVPARLAPVWLREKLVMAFFRDRVKPR